MAEQPSAPAQLAAKKTRSIGEVINSLRGEFPDLTVSKVRFLEAQGLINPTRSPSGYRMFTEDDLDRLRYVLSEQRDHFLQIPVQLQLKYHKHWAFHDIHNQTLHPNDN